PAPPAPDLAPPAPVAEPPVAAEASPSEADASVDERLFLAQGERIYKVKDMPTLQRWIVEKRVLPTDRISEDGKSWDVVSSRPDLRPFFAVIEQLKNVKRQLRKREREVQEVAQRAVQALATSSSSDIVNSLDRISVQDLAAGSLDSEMAATPARGVALEGGSATDDSLYGAASGASEAQPALESSDPFDVPDAGSASLRMGLSGDGSEPGGSTALPEDSASSIDPAASASWSPSSSLSDTRQVPLVPKPPEASSASGSFAGEEGESEGESEFWSQSGWESDAAEPAASVSSSGGLSDTDFDPDQTFDPLFSERQSRGGPGFYIVLLVLVALAGGTLWYFLAGPGRTPAVPVQADMNPGSSAVAAVAEPAEPAPSSPEPETEASPEIDSADQAGDPAIPEAGDPAPDSSSVAEATPEPVPDPTPTAPVVRDEPKEKPTPEPRPRPEKSKPDTEVDHLAKAERFFDVGSYSKASQSYKNALKVSPRNFKAALGLGWSEIELGRASSARSAFQKAAGLRRGSAEAQYGLGLAYDELGNRSKAIAAYKKALELSPNGRDAAEIKVILKGME
ncbi:MAG: tetratricopeptide repeat protein, partial [Myxococcota bacterium]|nr:tetratricopeptide repeat protein [Myxococcota bacterium]